MAPFPLDILKAQPHIERRQNGASPYQITITVVRPTTTYTTTIELGSATLTPEGNPPPPALTTGASSSGPPAPQLVNPAKGDKSDSGLVAGALIGSVVGFLLLVFILYKTCTCPFSRGGSASGSSMYYSDSESSLGSSQGYGSYRSEEMHFRGGGGSEWESKHHRVRKPKKARTRRHGRERSENYSDISSRRSRRAKRSERRGGGSNGGSAFGSWYSKSVGRSSKGSLRYERRDGGNRGGARIQTLDD